MPPVLAPLTRNPAYPIQLGGLYLYPKDISEDEEKIGTLIKAANGNRRFAQRATKKTWALTFDALPIATVNQLRLIFRASTTTTYIDEYGARFTVFCGDDKLSIGRGLIQSDGTVGYDVTITIKEA